MFGKKKAEAPVNSGGFSDSGASINMQPSFDSFTMPPVGTVLGEQHVWNNGHSRYDVFQSVVSKSGKIELVEAGHFKLNGSN